MCVYLTKPFVLFWCSPNHPPTKPPSHSRWSDSCRKTSDTLGFIYFAMVVVLAVMFRRKLKGVMEHFGNLLPVLFGAQRKRSSAALTLYCTRNTLCIVCIGIPHCIAYRCISALRSFSRLPSHSRNDSSE